jgi:REP element-mobilizing transposase RayT
MNRGVARRTLFEDRRDVRFFLSCLARRVHAGDIEVHAYSLLTNHFHLLVRSPRGQLSAAMRRVEDAFARWFNCRRGRDGHLFRGRFNSRNVEDDAYWETVLLYIDRNPVEAGLSATPAGYPHGSASHYLEPKGPPWLRRDVVEAWAGRRPGEPWNPEHYLRASDERWTEGRRWQAGRLAASKPQRGGGMPGDLLGAAPVHVRQWLADRARIADGVPSNTLFATPPTVRALIHARSMAAPSRSLHLSRKGWSLWEVLEAGALRRYCGLQLGEVADRLTLSRCAVQTRCAAHDRALQEDEFYRAEAALLLTDAIARDYGSKVGGRGQAPRVFCAGATPPRGS